ncbi:MAG: hypothetical protein EBZ77_13180, partial [Chitinophagia bacterium]|nr:hypothetical protein [Chitinophagia bacterium]
EKKEKKRKKKGNMDAGVKPKKSRGKRRARERETEGETESETRGETKSGFPLWGWGLVGLAILGLVGLLVYLLMTPTANAPTAPVTSTAPTPGPAQTPRPVPLGPVTGPTGPATGPVGPLGPVTGQTKATMVAPQQRDPSTNNNSGPVPVQVRGILSDLPWTTVESKTVKGCKATVVGTSLDPGSDEMYRAVLATRNTPTQVTTNRKGGFESAFKVEDTTDPSKTVYYLSQFHTKPDKVQFPCAVSEKARKKYNDFYTKKRDGDTVYYEKYSNDLPTLGHACELITLDSANVTKVTEAEAACSKDARCAGYYVATDQKGAELVGTRPVLASALPDSCTVSWARVPDTDMPKTTDLCNRYMGDGVWDDDGSNNCQPICAGDKGRTNTNLCKSFANDSKSSDRCLDGWILSNGGKANHTCLPVTEASCPIGWVLTEDDYYPGTGVCKPPCVKGAAQEREEDGFCKEDSDQSKGWTCFPGTRHTYYRDIHGKTDYCIPTPYNFYVPKPKTN